MEIPKEVRQIFESQGLTLRTMQGYTRVLKDKRPVLEFRMSKAGRLGARVGTSGTWTPMPNLQVLAAVARAQD